MEKMQRSVQFMMLVVLMGMVLPMTAWGRFSGGSGTAEDPYRILTREDFLEATTTDGSDAGAHYILLDDLALGGYVFLGHVFDMNDGVNYLSADLVSFQTPESEYYETIPELKYNSNVYLINDAASDPNSVNGAGLDYLVDGGFTGVFDGNGHVLRGVNMVIWAGQEGALGFFSRIGSGGIVKNLGLSGCQLSVRKTYYPAISEQCAYNVGGICSANFGTIENCYIEDMMYGFSGSSEVANDLPVGGFCGANLGTIRHCFVEGTIYNYYTMQGVAGFCGYLGAASVIDECYSSIDIDYASESPSWGFAGAIEDGAEVNGCVFNATDVEQLAAYDPNVAMGVLAGQMDDVDMYVGLGWDFETDWETYRGSMPYQRVFKKSIAFSGGRGTFDEPYLISNVSDLFDVNGAVSMEGDDYCYFRMVNDIDLRGIEFDDVVIDEFTGVFDGDGYSIIGFDCEVTKRGGFIDTLEGTVCRLNLVDASVVLTDGGEIGDGKWGGLFCVENNGLISDCHVSGTIVGEKYLGGICGYNVGGLISRSTSSASVLSYYYSGGICGVNEYGMIEKCVSTGIVKGYAVLGGICGSNSGGIRNCHADGPLGTINMGSTYVIGDLVVNEINSPPYPPMSGGIVGEMISGGVSNCYARVRPLEETIEDPNYSDISAGLCGQIENEDDVTIEGCFWDVSLSGVESTQGGGVGLTSEEMVDRAVYEEVGWDFDSVWTHVDGEVPGLLYVDGGERPGDRYAGGVGTMADPYLLSSKDDLDYLAAHPDDWDASFALVNDIDLGNEVYPYGVVYTGPCFTDLNDYGQARYFSGQLDGRGHSIVNMNIESEYYGYSGMGLFSVCYQADIYDLSLEGQITAAGGSRRVGFLAGTMMGCRVDKVRVDGSILYSNTTYVIWDDSFPSYTTMDDSIKISIPYASTSYLGGIAGRTAFSDIRRSCGHVLIMRDGLNVIGAASVGGLVGSTYETVFDNCYATGVIYGSKNVGGLTGVGGDFENCYAAVAVGGDRAVDGLAGSKAKCAEGCFWDMDVAGEVIERAGYLYPNPWMPMILNESTGPIDQAYYEYTDYYGMDSRGEGKTTEEMLDEHTYRAASWSFGGGIWFMPDGDYPRLVGVDETASFDTGIELIGLALEGESELAEDASGSYSVTVIYADDVEVALDPCDSEVTWEVVANSQYCQIEDGILTNMNYSGEDVVCTLRASYVSGLITVDDEIEVTLHDVDPGGVTGLAIVGETFVYMDGSQAYRAMATFEDGSLYDVTDNVEWHIIVGGEICHFVDNVLYNDMEGIVVAEDVLGIGDVIPILPDYQDKPIVEARILAEFEYDDASYYQNKDVSLIRSEEPNELLIEQVIVRAGRHRADHKDKVGLFMSFGTHVFAGQFDGQEIAVTVRNSDGVVMAGFPVVFDAGVMKRGKLKLKSDDGYLKIDMNKNDITVVLYRQDLTGLTAPMTVEVETDLVHLTGVAYDDGYEGVGDVINGRKPIPYELQQGYADSQEVTKLVFKDSDKDDRDKLYVMGRITMEELNFKDSILLRWGSYQVSYSSSSLKQVGHSNKYKLNGKGTSSRPAVFLYIDFDKGDYKLRIKGDTIDDQGDSEFSIIFDEHDIEIPPIVIMND